jgi:hypothetical protein
MCIYSQYIWRSFKFSWRTILTLCVTSDNYRCEKFLQTWWQVFDRVLPKEQVSSAWKCGALLEMLAFSIIMRNWWWKVFTLLQGEIQMISTIFSSNVWNMEEKRIKLVELFGIEEREVCTFKCTFQTKACFPDLKCSAFDSWLISFNGRKISIWVLKSAKKVLLICC